MARGMHGRKKQTGASRSRKMMGLWGGSGTKLAEVYADARHIPPAQSASNQSEVRVKSIGAASLD